MLHLKRKQVEKMCAIHADDFLIGDYTMIYCGIEMRLLFIFPSYSISTSDNVRVVHHLGGNRFHMNKMNGE